MDQHKHCQMCKSWGGWTHCQKCRSWDGWTQTLSNVCRSWDGLTKTDIRAPLPPMACSNESLAHSYHTNRTNFLPWDMNKTAANASTYIAFKGTYESNTDYNYNGVVERRRTGHRHAAESLKMETTAGIRQQSGFICSASDNFQHTQNPDSHA